MDTKQRKVVLGLLVALLIVGAAGYAFYYFSNVQHSSGSQSNLGQAAATIVRTDNGFEPDTVTIKKGDVITFSNTTKSFYWPASDIHPTHGIYPEFDPKRPIAPDETWSFKFDRVGTWRFHDHLQANITGTIVVTP